MVSQFHKRTKHCPTVLLHKGTYSCINETLMELHSQMYQQRKQVFPGETGAKIRCRLWSQTRLTSLCRLSHLASVSFRSLPSKISSWFAAGCENIIFVKQQKVTGWLQREVSRGKGEQGTVRRKADTGCQEPVWGRGRGARWGLRAQVWLRAGRVRKRSARDESRRSASGTVSAKSWAVSHPQQLNDW